MFENKLYIRGARLEANVDVNSNIYPFNLPFLKSGLHLDFEAPVTFFVGENGMGKSTLLEAMAVKYGFNPEGGSRNFMFSTMDTHSTLEKHLKLTKGYLQPKDGYFLRAESFYNMATSIERDYSGPDVGDLNTYYGGKSLHEQLHGESFMALMHNRFWGEGIYLLDEPEAAMSPQKQMAFLLLLHEQVKMGSQFVIATHSPIVMAFPGADICLFTEEGIARVAYEDTDHYNLTKRFLNNTDAYLKRLFEDA